MHDPCHVVHAALVHLKCDPRGPVHDFRAHCPAHEDSSHDLHVKDGCDGRAVLYCHARQCDPGDIVRALGLTWGDLFPDGHRHAPRGRRWQPPVASMHPAQGVLALLTGAGIAWRSTAHERMWVADRCPSCGFDSMWVYRWDSRVGLCCGDGCRHSDILAALAARAMPAAA